MFNNKSNSSFSLLFFVLFISFLTRTFTSIIDNDGVVPGSRTVSSSPGSSSLSASVLLVSSLDGRVTALRADNGRIVWSLETGGSLISVHQTADTSAEDAATEEETFDKSDLSNVLPRISKQPFIIPSRDGSIMTLSPFSLGDADSDGIVGIERSRALLNPKINQGPLFHSPLPGELTQLPYRAPELVASHLPFASGNNLLLGSKTTSMLQVSLSTGRVLRVLSGVANVPSSGENSNNEKNVWISRSDYVVKSFDSGKSFEHWNVTYSEVSPVSSLNVKNNRKNSVESDFESSPTPFPRRESNNFTESIRLSATMQGRVIATSVASNARGWVGPDLGSPISSIFVVSISNEEDIELMSVPFSEIWPRSTKTSSNAAVPYVKESRVYVGRLPGGQIYAAREDPNSIELVADAEDNGIDIEEVEREVEQLLLEKPLVDISTCEGDECAVALVGMYSAPINDASSFALSLGPLVSANDDAFNSELPLARQWIQAGQSSIVKGGAVNNDVAVSSSTTALSLPAPSTPVKIIEVERKSRKKVQWLLSLSEFLVSKTLRITDTNDREDAEGYAYDTLFAAGTMTFAALVGANASLFYLSWLRAQRRRRKGANGRSEQNNVILDENSEGENSQNSLQQQKNSTQSREIIVDGISHKLVGRLAVSESSIGFGSHGTLVLRGLLDKRPVAVKRMLIAFHPAARREISLLIKTDGHPNVVRYHACEEDGDFVYLALELCERGSLALAVEACARARAAAGIKRVPVLGPATRRFLSGIISGIAHLHRNRIVHRDIKPQNILLAKAEAVVKDLTGSSLYPENEYTDIGVSTLPKISDFGLGKQLSAGEHSTSQGLTAARIPSAHPFSSSSVSSSMIAPGSVGWQAPEIVLLGRRAQAKMIDHDAAALPRLIEVDEEDRENSKDGLILSAESPNQRPNTGLTSDLSDKQKRSADIWSLGCVLYNVIDAGNHPFGEPFERETNAVHDKRDLSRIFHLPEARSLIESMLSSDASKRPSIAEVSEHVLFWSDEKRSEFLCSLSDRLESELEREMANNQTNGEERTCSLTSAFEAEHAVAVLGETRAKVVSSWYPKMPAALMTEMMRKRRYEFILLRDLLRLVRNMRSHLRELSPRVLEAIGATDGDASIVAPWVLSPSRFPQLLLRCYMFVCDTFAHEPSFSVHLGPVTSKKFGPAAADRLIQLNTRTEPTFMPLYVLPGMPPVVESLPSTQFIPADTTLSQMQLNHVLSLQRLIQSSFSSDMSIGAGSGGAGSMPLQPSRFSADSPPFEPKMPSSPSAFSSSSASFSSVISSTVAASPSRQWWLNEEDWQEASIAMSNRINTPEGGAIIVVHNHVDSNGFPISDLVPVICAYQRCEETKFQNGAHVHDSRYKCKECKDWMDGSGVCPRGVRCDFAHGPIELKVRKALKVGIDVATVGGIEARLALGHFTVLRSKEL